MPTRIKGLQAAILGQLAEGVIVTDAQGRISLVNEAAAAIHGVARLDVEPEDYTETYHLFTEAGDPFPALDLPLARAVRGETVSDAKWRIRRPDGIEVFAIGAAKPLLDEAGDQIGAVLTLRDDTGRVRAERALRELNDSLARAVDERTADAERARAEAVAASTAKSNFLANMSHEIRTPLNGVIAVADLLSRAELGEREQGMVEIIRASGETLQHLLSDILDIARIESGKVVLDVAPFHLGEVLRSAADLCRLRCDETGVTLAVEIAREVDAAFVGDAGRLRQVVTNFLSNALKFTDTGEIRLSADAPVGGRVRICVADTGVGFDISQKARVLGRFEQADASITRRFGGTGLGLAICRELAVLMGGEIDCDSAPGVGSRFWITLPLERAATERSGATNARRVDGGAVPGRLRILLADDHVVNRRIAQLMLEDVDADLTCVEDGAQAVASFGDGAFDLILMDMQMPVLDGLSALRRIRRIEAERCVASTPAIMLTANAMPDHVAAGRDAGAQAHLAKPFTARALFDAIASAIDATA